MARPTTRSATRGRSGGGFMLGIFVGLFVGLAVALGIAFYLNRTQIPFVSAKPKPVPEKDAKGQPPIAGMPQGTTPAGTPEKPKFDFYKILPGNEEQVTEKDLRAARSQKGSQQNVSKDVYFIQAGAFQNPADADNQKARLAILGFESSVEPANLPDKGTWYRVRMGPYTKVDEINRVRASLAQSGIDASLVKIKEPAQQ
jgi:cell division protein FtsN